MADPFHSSPTAAAAGDSLLAPQTSDAPEAALPAVAPDLDAEFGFQRPEFGKEKLAGTVGFHQRHVFLCYKSPAEWPSHVEATDSDRPPRILADAIKARKSNLNKSTKLTICEGEDGTESSLGDVLIFPDMIRYRGLTHFDVDNFVEEVLVKDVEWLPGSPEAIKGSYVFVCAHGSRDKRCGVCGPALITRFKEEIEGQGLDGQVAVSACSHVGGHKYAGNVIIFSSDAKGEVTGHWYGYVAPDDVPVLLHKHIGQGEIVDHLWRGQLGMTEEQQKKALELKHITNGVTGEESSTKEANGTNGTACNPATKQDKSVPLKGTNIGDVVEADWMKKGTQFVESFYKTLDSAPETLHEFYSAKCDVTWEIFQDSRRMKSSKEIQEFLALPANQFFFCFSLKRHVVQTSKKAIHVAAYGIYTAEKESHNFMQSFVLRHRNRRILNDALLVLCDDREVKEDVVAAARTKFTEDKQSVAEELGCRTANANRRVAPRKFKLKIVPKLAAGSKLTTPEAGDEVKRFDVMLVYNEECLEHIPYENPEHHEHPDRIRRIMARLEADGILERVLRQRSEPAERKHLLAAHSEQHVSNIDRLPEQFGTGDMYSSAGTKDAVYLAAGAVIKACEAVFKGHVKKAFALVRPPGHHASTNTAEGFCYVNNVAVGSKYLQNECLVEKVLQVDIDVHHGNGSQCIFYESNTVMVFSTHCLDLKYPPKYNVEKNRRPFHTCTGEKEGKGYNVNMPMQLGFGDSDILYAIDQILAPLVSVFKPGKIIVSAGFDVADGDPLGRCKVTPKCYGTVIDKLVEMGNGELILCLEGGYGSESLPACVSHCLRALLGDKAASLSEDELSSLPEPLEDTKDTVRKLKKLLMNQWEVLRN